jgi:hypothetical protein
MKLRTAAWINLILHLAGLGLALLMRPGTGMIPLAERMQFLAGGPLGWKLGWSMWMLCALALGLFFVVLSPHLSPLIRRAALLCATAAITVDLFCDAAQIVLLPLAARGETAPFLLWERVIGLGGTLIANGLYTLGALIVTFSIDDKRVRGLGLVLGLAGGAMCVGGVLDVPRVIELSTGPTIVVYCVWAMVLARRFEPV